MWQVADVLWYTIHEKIPFFDGCVRTNHIKVSSFLVLRSHIYCNATAKDVRSRETFGHWELDTVVSSRGKSKGCLATFLERKTRFYLTFKIPDRTVKSLFSAIEQLCKLFPKEALKTFTSDREKELSCDPLVENLGISFFFADAYSSWQRGSNENANGLLREYFPKKTDLATISDEALNKVLYDINHRPRKCLAYRTASEALEDEFE